MLQASMLELDFLREVDARGDLYSKEVVHRAVYRFNNNFISRRFWKNSTFPPLFCNWVPPLRKPSLLKSIEWVRWGIVDFFSFFFLNCGFDQQLGQARSKTFSTDRWQRCEAAPLPLEPQTKSNYVRTSKVPLKCSAWVSYFVEKFPDYLYCPTFCALSSVTVCW